MANPTSAAPRKRGDLVVSLVSDTAIGRACPECRLGPAAYSRSSTVVESGGIPLVTTASHPPAIGGTPRRPWGQSPAPTLPRAIPRWLHVAATFRSASEIAAGSCLLSALSNVVAAPSSVRFPECSPASIFAFGTNTNTLLGVGVAETEPQSACAPDEGPDEHAAAPAPKNVTSATPPRRCRFREVIRTRAASHRGGSPV